MIAEFVIQFSLFFRSMSRSHNHNRPRGPWANESRKKIGKDSKSYSEIAWNRQVWPSHAKPCQASQEKNTCRRALHKGKGVAAGNNHSPRESPHVAAHSKAHSLPYTFSILYACVFARFLNIRTYIVLYYIYNYIYIYIYTYAMYMPMLPKSHKECLIGDGLWSLHLESGMPYLIATHSMRFKLTVIRWLEARDWCAKIAWCFRMCEEHPKTRSGSSSLSIEFQRCLCKNRSQ